MSTPRETSFPLESRVRQEAINFFPPITTESFGFCNLITLPNNGQAFVPKTQTKIQPTITIHNPLYIAQNKLLKTHKWAKYLGMCRLDERAKSPFFYVRLRLGDTSAKRLQVTEHRPVLWSRRERNRTRVREGVGRFCGVDEREIE